MDITHILEEYLLEECLTGTGPGMLAGYVVIM